MGHPSMIVPFNMLPSVLGFVNLWAYPRSLQKKTRQITGIQCYQGNNLFIQSIMRTPYGCNLELHAKGVAPIQSSQKFLSCQARCFSISTASWLAWAFSSFSLRNIQRSKVWQTGKKKIVPSKGRIIWFWNFSWRCYHIGLVLCNIPRNRAYSSKLQGTNICDFRHVNLLRIQEPNADVGSADACSHTFQQKSVP